MRGLLDCSIAGLLDWRDDEQRLIDSTSPIDLIQAIEQSPW